MSRLSIIIPCPGEPRDFEDTLASVLANRPDDCEVLVPLRVRYDDPYELGSEVGFLFFPEVETPVELFNAALPCAKGDVIHLLQCGLNVADGWADAALRPFSDRSVASVAPRVELAGRTIAGVRRSWSGRRCLVQVDRHAEKPPGAIGPVLAAGFYRRRELSAVGGMADDVPPLLADLQTALRLQAVGLRHATALDSVVSGTWRAPRASAWRRGRFEERIERCRQAVEESPRGPLYRIAQRLAAALAQPGIGGKTFYLGGRTLGGMEPGIEAEARRRHEAAQQAIDRIEPPASSEEPVRRRAA